MHFVLATRTNLLRHDRRKIHEGSMVTSRPINYCLTDRFGIASEYTSIEAADTIRFDRNEMK